MKKLICLALLIAVFMYGFTIAFAAGGDESTFGYEKFEQYLSTLKPEHAEMIRADKELVYTMTRDSYWAAQSAPITHASTSLPLSNYPAGSFFTANGKACTCHKNCTWPAYDANYINKINNCSLSSGNGNCNSFNSAIQCKGFADYVFYKYSGVTVSDSNAVDADLIPTNVGNNTLGADDLHAFLRNIPTGTNIRAYNRNTTYGERHSFIVLSTTSSDITFYDCNRSSSPCKVDTVTMTWKELAAAYKGIAAAWTPSVWP